MIPIERLATDLAAEAGRLALAQFRRDLDVEYKGRGQGNPVTEADRAAEDLIRTGIAGRFPGHCVIGEERQDTYNPETAYLWVIDPIDGTTNFVNGLPLFCVSIGVLHHFRPVAGAIWVAAGPAARPGVFHARRGGGAWFDNDPIRAVSDTELRGGRTVARPGGFPGRFRIGKSIRRQLGEPRVLGSIAYEIAYVAAGSLGYALFGSARVWDVAAGAAIVREAGGAVLTYRRGRWHELEVLAAARRRAKQPLAHIHAPLPPLIVAGSGLARALAGGLRYRRPGWITRLRRRFRRS